MKSWALVVGGPCWRWSVPVGLAVRLGGSRRPDRTRRRRLMSEEGWGQSGLEDWTRVQRQVLRPEVALELEVAELVSNDLEVRLESVALHSQLVEVDQEPDVDHARLLLLLLPPLPTARHSYPRSPGDELVPWQKAVPNFLRTHRLCRRLCCGCARPRHCHCRRRDPLLHELSVTSCEVKKRCNLRGTKSNGS